MYWVSLSESGLEISSKGGALSVKVDGKTVYNRTGKNVKAFHNGDWVKALKDLSVTKEITRWFS